jgi:hypothetical protein
MPMKQRLPFTAALALLASTTVAFGGESVPGRCLAVVAGRTLVQGWCSIARAPGGAFRFWQWGTRGAFEVRPGADGLAEALRYSWNDAASVGVSIGPLKRDGACWVGERTKLCAWSGEAEMLANRNASYTAFHALLGRDVKASCGIVYCSWFRFDRATLLAHDDHETLVRIDGSTWDTDARPNAKDKGKLDIRTGPFYYRCSRTRPAVIHHYRDGWKLQPLAPDGTIGASSPAQLDYAEYAAACDGLDHAVVAAEGVQLGYHTDDAAEDFDVNSVAISGLDATLK